MVVSSSSSSSSCCCCCNSGSGSGSRSRRSSSSRSSRGGGGGGGVAVVVVVVVVGVGVGVGVVVVVVVVVFFRFLVVVVVGGGEYSAGWYERSAAKQQEVSPPHGAPMTRSQPTRSGCHPAWHTIAHKSICQHALLKHIRGALLRFACKSKAHVNIGFNVCFRMAHRRCSAHVLCGGTSPKFHVACGTRVEVGAHVWIHSVPLQSTPKMHVSCWNTCPEAYC